MTRRKKKSQLAFPFPNSIEDGSKTWESDSIYLRALYVRYRGGTCFRCGAQHMVDGRMITSAQLVKMVLPGDVPVWFKNWATVHGHRVAGHRFIGLQ